MKSLFSEQDLAFKEEARRWFEENTPEDIRGNVFMFGTLTREQNIAWGRKLNERGWAAINWPAEYGGTDWSATRKHLFELARAEAAAPTLHSMGIAMLGPVLCTFGTDEQKAKYLPRILRFEDWWCQGYSEPGAGSDLAALKTRAELDGDHYLVNGSKIWTSYAHFANRMFCLVRTSTEGKKQAGISFVLIDMDDPGIEVRPIISIDGGHHLNQVFFDDARVPKENLVGEEGEGWAIAKYLLTHERTGIARIPLSLVELEKIKARALEIEAGGTLQQQEGIGERIAEIEIDLKCLDQTNSEMLAALDAGKAPGPESSMLKVQGTLIQQRLAEVKLELAGYAGLPWGEDVDRVSNEEREILRAAASYNFSRASTIYGGSTEVQYNVMAKTILGL